MSDLQQEPERIIPIDLGVIFEPCPVVLDCENRTFLISLLSSFDRSQDRYAIIEWLRCSDIRFGSPDEEWRTQHHLYDIGLREVRGGTGEVLNSTWQDETGWEDPVDPPAPRVVRHQRHFVVLFHDSTLQCLADGFRVETTSRPFLEIMAALAKQIDIQRDPNLPDWPIIGAPVITGSGASGDDRR